MKDFNKPFSPPRIDSRIKISAISLSLSALIIVFSPLLPLWAFRYQFLIIAFFSVLTILTLFSAGMNLFPMEILFLYMAASNFIFPLYMNVQSSTYIYLFIALMILFFSLYSEIRSYSLAVLYLALSILFLEIAFGKLTVSPELFYPVLMFIALTLSLYRNYKSSQSIDGGSTYGKREKYGGNVLVPQLERPPQEWPDHMEGANSPFFHNTFILEILDPVLERIRSLTKAEMVCIIVPTSSSGMHWKIAAISQDFDPGVHYKVDVDGGYEPVKIPFLLARECMISGEKIDSIYNGFNSSVIPEFLISLPIAVQGKTKAVLYVEKHYSDRADSMEKEALTMAAEFISKSVKLYTRLTESNKDIRKFMYMSGFIKDLGDAIDIPGVFHIAAEKISELLNAPLSLIESYKTSAANQSFRGVFSRNPIDISTLSPLNETEGTIIHWCMEKRVKRILDFRQDDVAKVAQLPSEIKPLSKGKQVIIYPFSFEGDDAEKMDGVIVVVGGEDMKFSPEDIDHIDTIMNVVRMSIERVIDYSAVKKESGRDPLTGLCNRREFSQRINAHFSHVKREKRVMSFLILDIDHFKELNDTFGHGFGDEVLKVVSRIMSGIIRPYDTLARYGGEEFAIILPDTDRQEAINIAERIRKSVKSKKFDSKGVEARVTLSIGISTYPHDGTSQDELLELADKSLYFAKRSGRNSVRSAIDLLQ